MKLRLILTTTLLLLTGILSYSMDQDEIRILYEETGMAREVSYEVFRDSMVGYERIINKEREGIVTIIDYSKPSNEERFYVVDIDRGRIVYKSLVAHARNSGGERATSFSNVVNSRKTSVGFYLTGETYYGKNGYSLRLDGLEKGINDNARKRDIVIHGADYATEDFIRRYGRLGRSWGCPALPRGLNRKVIDEIKGGSVIFVYGEDRGYEERSAIL